MRGKNIKSSGGRSLSLRSLVALVSLVLLSGCFRPTFHPEGVPVPTAAGESLCQELNAKRSTVTSLRAIADATISRGGDQVSFRYAVLSKDPASFRVDVLPPATQGAYTLGLLVAHEDRVLWLNPQEKTYVEGRSARELIAEHLGLRGVSRETAVALMTGAIPVLTCKQVRVYELANGDLLLVDNVSNIAWHTKGRSAQLRALKVFDEESASLEMEGVLSREESGVIKGIFLDVFAPAAVRVDMTLTRVVLNPSLNQELFQIAPPADYIAAD